jgi:4-carboxymuconolactone decarboxylase
MAARVPYVERDQLDAEGQEIYDTIRRDRNSANVGFQFRAMLHSPKAAGYLTSLGSQLRFKSALPEDIKELAIILVAREWNSRIEWTGHSQLAAKAGVSAESIEAIRTRKAPEGLTEKEQVIARYVQQLLREKEVSDQNFAAASKLLGDKGVVDLTLTVCYYTSLGLAQLALKPDMEAGKVSTL